MRGAPTANRAMSRVDRLKHEAKVKEIWRSSVALEHLGDHVMPRSRGYRGQYESGIHHHERKERGSQRKKKYRCTPANLNNCHPRKTVKGARIGQAIGHHNPKRDGLNLKRECKSQDPPLMAYVKEGSDAGQYSLLWVPLSGKIYNGRS